MAHRPADCLPYALLGFLVKERRVVFAPHDFQEFVSEPLQLPALAIVQGALPMLPPVHGTLRVRSGSRPKPIRWASWLQHRPSEAIKWARGSVPEFGWGNSMHNVTRAFNPEATHSLCAAFDKVCSTIGERDRSEFVREMIARRVIALAERGEQDPPRLAEAVTSSLGCAAKTDHHL